MQLDLIQALMYTHDADYGIDLYNYSSSDVHMFQHFVYDIASVEQLFVEQRHISRTIRAEKLVRCILNSIVED